MPTHSQQLERDAHLWDIMKQIMACCVRGSNFILIVYWFAMFVGTHWPAEHLPGTVQLSDKVLHFLAYFGLGVLLSISLARKHLFGLLGALVAFSLLATYGGIDEISQIPFGRIADIYDWFADLAGAALGIMTISGLIWFLRRSTFLQNITSG